MLFRMWNKERIAKQKIRACQIRPDFFVLKQDIPASVKTGYPCIG